jgi:hemoglobin
MSGFASCVVRTLINACSTFSDVLSILHPRRVQTPSASSGGIGKTVRPCGLTKRSSQRRRGDLFAFGRHWPGLAAHFVNSGRPLIEHAMNTSSGKLWDGLGGEKVLTNVVDRFVELVTANLKVNYTRDGRYPLNEEILKHSKRAALEFISAATGGPHSYSGKSIRDVHKGMRISNQEFNAAMADFQQALEESAVSPELVQAAVGMVDATRSHIVELS